MIWTAIDVEAALGMSGVTLVDGGIVAGEGLDLAVANARLEVCVVAKKLEPDAEAYQVRAWMIRSGIPLSVVPTMIANAVPAGPARDEALMRWEFAVRVPKDHPLVAVVASGLGVSVDAIWWEVLAL
jgi:hypothetical protein